MKVYRLIEYEADDNDPGAVAHLERTLALSIDGSYRISGLRITAVQLDAADLFDPWGTGLLPPSILEDARARSWEPSIERVVCRICGGQP